MFGNLPEYDGCDVRLNVVSDVHTKDPARNSISYRNSLHATDDEYCTSAIYPVAPPPKALIAGNHAVASVGTSPLDVLPTDKLHAPGCPATSRVVDGLTATVVNDDVFVMSIFCLAAATN